MERRAEIAGVEVSVIRITAKYLVVFLVLAISLELLDLIFRRYTAVKSWDVLASAVYGHEFRQVFLLQYGLGNLVPLILFLIPRLTSDEPPWASSLVLFGVFMMRWNVVIGGQSFSLTLAGYMHYVLPIVPHFLGDVEGGGGRRARRPAVPVPALLPSRQGLSGLRATGRDAAVSRPQCVRPLRPMQAFRAAGGSCIVDQTRWLRTDVDGPAAESSAAWRRSRRLRGPRRRRRIAGP